MPDRLPSLVLIPDRLPSLVLLVGFWVPAAVAGRAAADIAQRKSPRVRPALVYLALTTFVVASSAAWFFINLNAVPPYLPGATMDPTYAPPQVVAGLVVVTSVLVLPGTALACWLAFRFRARSLGRTTAR